MHDDDTVLIPLRARDGSIRAHAVVDADDAVTVSQWRWSMNSNGYAVRNDHGSARQSILLHRELLGLVRGDGISVDHINRDKLDCRRSNMRIATIALNNQNLPSHRGASSPHRGVYWDATNRKWHARVTVQRKTYDLGRFVAESEAAEACRTARMRFMPYAID